MANFNIHHLTELKNERPDNLPVGKLLCNLVINLRKCKMWIALAVNQIEIHPFLAWEQCTSFCKKEDIAVMAYSPLAKANKLRDPTLCKVARQ